MRFSADSGPRDLCEAKSRPQNEKPRVFAGIVAFAFAFAGGQLVVACSSHRPPRVRAVDPTIAGEKPVDPPLGPKQKVESSPSCALGEVAIDKDKAHAQGACRWRPIATPKCSGGGAAAADCPVTRMAFADCGFRGRNPDAFAIAGETQLVTIVHAQAGEFMITEDNRTIALPPHIGMVSSADGLTLLMFPNPTEHTTMVWSSHREGPPTCETVSFTTKVEAGGAASSLFYAPHDASLRGWIEDGLIAREPSSSSSSSSWVAYPNPEPSSLRGVAAPHVTSSGLDARVWTTFEHGRFRILAQRWGYSPIVIRELSRQPVDLSFAPPSRHAGPRVPAIVAQTSMSIMPMQATKERKEDARSRIDINLPDRERGFAPLTVDLGEQRTECEQSFAKDEKRPSRGVSATTPDTNIVRTLVDDALWLVTRRHHVECTFVSDRAKDDRDEGDRGGGARHPRPDERFHPKIVTARDEIVIYAIREGDSPDASEVLHIDVPREAPAQGQAVQVQQQSVVGLDVAAAGARLHVVTGGVGIWIDTSRVDR